MIQPRSLTSSDSETVYTSHRGLRNRVCFFSGRPIAEFQRRGWRPVWFSEHCPAVHLSLHGSFPCLGQTQTSRPMFMETVNVLAAPSKQGLAAAAPWLKITQCCGCENPNKHESGLVVAQLQKRPPRQCQNPALVTLCSWLCVAGLGGL